MVIFKDQDLILYLVMPASPRDILGILWCIPVHPDRQTMNNEIFLTAEPGYRAYHFCLHYTIQNLKPMHPSQSVKEVGNVAPNVPRKMRQ